MPWYKVDDRFTTHLKYLKLPPDKKCMALGLWIQAGTWSSLNLLDGFVPCDVLGHFGTDRDIADVLVDANYWSVVPGGYQFVNWDEYQPTRADQDKKRSADAERKRRQRAREAGEDPDAHQSHSVTDRDAAQSRDVQPSRPDPSRPSKRNVFTYSEEFERWWAVYPRKKSKGGAAKAYEKAVKIVSAEHLLQAARFYARSVRDTEENYIPYPSTWLNERRFDDENLSVAAPEDRLRKAWEDGYDPELSRMASEPFNVEWPDPMPADRDVFLYVISGAKHRNPAAAKALIERLG